MRERIIETTLEIIASGDHKNVSAGKISQKLGISKANLFHHFKSMSDLIYTSFDYFLYPLTKDIYEKKFNSLEEFLHIVGHSILQMSEENPNIQKIFLYFFNYAITEEKLKEKMDDFIFSHREKLVQQMMSLGVSQQKSQDLALLLMINFDGFGIYALFVKDKKQLQRSWNQISKYLCQEATT